MSEWSGLLCCDVTPASFPLQTSWAPTCLSFAECFLQPVGPHILGLVAPAPLSAPRLGPRPPVTAPALLFAHGDSQDDPVRMTRVSLASLVTALSLVTGPPGHQVTGCSHLGSQVGTDSDSDTLPHSGSGSGGSGSLAWPGLPLLPGSASRHTPLASSCHITQIIG